MIKEILNLMYDNTLTLVQIAENLRITRQELFNRLETLEHMGYIKKICTSTSNEKERCISCAMSDVCVEGDSKESFGISFQLTKKGKKVCQK
jgi:DNA-binding Lrp family transcriptional regulator